MTLHRSSLATLAQASYNYLAVEGYDADDIFQRSGMDPAHIYDANARFPIYVNRRFWQIMLQETGNPCVLYEVVNAMGYAWIASRTLSEALERLIRYHRMLSTNIEMSLESAQGVSQLVASMIETIPETTESVIVFSLQLCRQSFGDDLVPMQVKLTRPKPEDSSPIDKYFRCQVDYNYSKNVIVYNSADLNRRLDGANSAVVIAMESVINTYVERFDANDVVSRVRQVVAASLANGEPAKQDIADQLGMAPRTLQRRLEEQQSSVKVIVDETRHQLSLEFLDQAHYTVKEIAYNLGFSDASNFSRAFRRWEDKSPREYRIST